MFKKGNMSAKGGEALLFENPSIRLEQKDMERIFTRLFSSEDGQKVLSYLQVMTFQRAYGPNATDEQLRHAEGQRALMATILRMVDRGRAMQ